jgi:hypothetical protein
MSDTKILIMFKNQVLAFCDELIEQFPCEGDFVVLRMFIDGRIPIKVAMEGFNKNINRDDQKLRHMITSRNENFFINENPFTFMSSDKITRLSGLWSNGDMDQEDKEVIWKWVDSLVTIGDKYTEVVNST